MTQAEENFYLSAFNNFWDNRIIIKDVTVPLHNKPVCLFLLYLPSLLEGLTTISHWNNGSHPITKVKQYSAWSVLRWVTTWECGVLWAWVCAGGVMDSRLEWEIGELSSNSSQVPYIYLSTNTLGKGMNLHVLPLQLWVK